MAGSTGTRADTGRGQGSAQPQKGWYVYGILPADIELDPGPQGVGDPPGHVRVARSGDLAALVSEVDLSGRLGSPEDLAAHKDILDASAAEVPVLPMRFGAVLASEEAVAQELLDPNHDEFADALKELDGRVQYLVRGRYDEKAILKEVLSGNPEAARLREQIRDTDPDATRDARIQLGEIVNQAVTAKRAEDTHILQDTLAEHAEASVVRDPTHELDAVYVAFLVEVGRDSELRRAAEDLATDWAGRIELRVTGPMAAYDFVVTTEPEG